MSSEQEQEQNLKQEQQQQQDQQSIAGTEYATDQADEQDTSIRDSSSADSDAPVIQQQPLPKEAEESEPEAVISGNAHTEEVINYSWQSSV